MAKAVFVRREKLTPSIYCFWFSKEADFEYLAGQYIELTIPGEAEALIGGNRWFTLSSSPSEELLSITTKIIEPVSKFKKTLLQLKANQELTMSEPIGDFVLPKDKSLPLVFISGGIGITPVRSIIKWLIDTGEMRTISLYYLVNKTEDLVYKNLLEDYQMSFHPVVASQLENDLSSYLLELIKGFDPKSFFYVSGPQTLVENTTDDIASMFGRDRVVMDYFPGYTSL